MEPIPTVTLVAATKLYIGVIMHMRAKDSARCRIECSLNAKHALAQVVMGAAAAQIFTLLDSLSKKRS